MSFTIEDRTVGSIVVPRDVAEFFVEQARVFKGLRLDYWQTKNYLGQILSKEELIPAGDDVWFLAQTRWIFVIQNGYVKRIAPLPHFTNHARDRLQERYGMMDEIEQEKLLAHDLVFSSRSWQDEDGNRLLASYDRTYVLSKKGDAIITILTTT